jgi:hypothetical protein
MQATDFNVTASRYFNILSWRVTDATSPVLWDIYRSEAPGQVGSVDGYDIIASGINLLDGDYYDYTVSGLYDFPRTWYYNIVASGQFANTVPIFYGSNQSDYIVAEILYRKALILDDTKAGRYFRFIKRKTWGTHCTKCWDPVLFRQSDPLCPVCWGTGWVGGYFTAQTFKGMINSDPNYNQITMFGEWRPSDVMLWTLDTPLLNPKDIIVDDNNKRWLVGQVRYVQKYGHIIEQNAQLSLLSTDDVMYSWEIN